MQGKVNEMAELLYMQQPRQSNKEDVLWDKLPKRDQNRYIDKVSDVLNQADKMGLTLLPTPPEGSKLKAADQIKHNIDIADDIIKEFVKGVKHPKGVADLFPCRELAARIVTGKLEPKLKEAKNGKDSM